MPIRLILQKRSTKATIKYELESPSFQEVKVAIVKGMRALQRMSEDIRDHVDVNNAELESGTSIRSWSFTIEQSAEPIRITIVDDDKDGQPVVSPELIRQIKVGLGEDVSYQARNRSTVSVDSADEERVVLLNDHSTEAHQHSLDDRAAPKVRVIVWEEALKKAQSHARCCPRTEVGGICMGIPKRDKETGDWTVELTDTFIGEHTVNRGASITFTPDTWSAAHRVIDKDYADTDERMIGWYHTHPSYGIFLSSFDLFIHENFFTEPWHIALVIDPNYDEWGVFVWAGHGKDRSVTRCEGECLELRKGAYPRKKKESKPEEKESVESRNFNPPEDGEHALPPSVDKDKSKIEEVAMHQLQTEGDKANEFRDPALSHKGAKEQRVPENSIMDDEGYVDEKGEIPNASGAKVLLQGDNTEVEKLDEKFSESAQDDDDLPVARGDDFAMSQSESEPPDKELHHE